MARTKKPRKAYRPREIIMPLKMRDDWMLEGGVHAALLALTNGCNTSDHLHDLGAHAMLVQSMAKDGSAEQRHAQSILRTVSGIIERGYAGNADVVAVKASASITLDFLLASRNHDIAKASIALVADFDRRKVA